MGILRSAQNDNLVWRGFSINELSAVSYPANSFQRSAISWCTRGRGRLRLELGEDGQLGDVVEDDHRGEQHDADERHLVDALLDRHGKVAAERKSTRLNSSHLG